MPKPSYHSCVYVIQFRASFTRFSISFGECDMVSGSILSLIYSNVPLSSGSAHLGNAHTHKIKDDIYPG